MKDASSDQSAKAAALVIRTSSPPNSRPSSMASARALVIIDVKRSGVDAQALVFRQFRGPSGLFEIPVGEDHGRCLLRELAGRPDREAVARAGDQDRPRGAYVVFRHGAYSLPVAGSTHSPSVASYASEAVLPLAFAAVGMIPCVAPITNTQKLPDRVELMVLDSSGTLRDDVGSEGLTGYLSDEDALVWCDFASQDGGQDGPYGRLLSEAFRFYELTVEDCFT